MENVDVVVIGGGPGGYPAAIRAAQLGASVALVEREAMGGTCLNWGCIPTKALIASSDLYARMRNSTVLGLKPGRVGYDYAAMNVRKNAVVATLSTGVSHLLKANGVKAIKGTASFMSRNQLHILRQKKEQTIEAGRVIIASGSDSVMPAFIPRHKRVLASRRFLDLTELPASLIVLGGGVIGCEFACLAAQLGVKVTIVEMLEDILMVLDTDIRRALRRHMQNVLRIRILTGEPMLDIQANEDGVNGAVGKKTIKAEMMLASIGRCPVTNGLNLEVIGLETDKRGAIPIDGFCRTAIAGIYAVGDATAASTQLAHAATAQGIAAAENACRPKPREAETLVPACIFTSPEVGSVGLSEAQAAESGLEIETGKFAFGGLGKAMAAAETEGFVKWIARSDTGQLVGAHAIGAHATELINEATVAIRAELTADDLGRTIHCHPTFSEAWMEAAHSVNGECIHAAPRRRRQGRSLKRIDT